jgi:hypothetical protein
LDTDQAGPHPQTLKHHENSTVFEWFWDVPTKLNISGQDFHLGKPSLHFIQSVVRSPSKKQEGYGEVSWYENSFDQVGMYTYGGNAFSFAELRNSGICQPQKQYQWGFAFLLAFAFFVVSIVLFTGLYVAWCFSKFDARSERTQEVFGGFKTAVEVTSLLRENIGADVDSMENKAIEEAVRASNGRVIAQDDG